MPISRPPLAIDDYAFVRVEGDGVHEIPVGPVHAGIIEPGHFRFSVVGEKVLRLEEHLGYVHKGIERRFTELPLLEGHRLAARVSGDSAVAFSWAYCQALEGIERCARACRVQHGCERLRWSWSASRITSAIWARWATTRALPSAWPSSPGSRNTCCAPPNDALGTALPHGPGRAGRHARRPFTQRRSRRRSPASSRSLTEVATLRAIYDEHAGLRDRFAGAGR